MTTSPPVIKSFSQSTRDERCLEVWFDKEVTDHSRSWLLEAINEKALRKGAFKAVTQENGGQAIIEDGAIVIRVSLDALPMVLEGAWAMNKFDTRYKITDVSEFAKELTRALNHEDEQGTTAIHELFDQAILDAIEQGAFGIDEHENQTV